MHVQKCGGIVDEALLSGRVALVTGGSRGIGAAICERLAAHGASIGIGYRTNHRAAEEVAARVRHAGRHAVLAPGDVTHETAVQEAVALVQREVGPIDILVNNAFPGFRGGAIEDLPWTTYQWYVDQIVRAAYNTIRAVLPDMKERKWGRIINLGTTSMYEFNRYHTAYISAKGALLALTRGLARDLGPHNICVNMVSPGLVYTDPMPPPSGWGEPHASRTALGRNPTAWEVAGAVVFLASPLADAITGVQLPVCCGQLMQVG